MALFKTFRMQNGDRQIFFFRSFRKVKFQKMQFLKDGVQTVVLTFDKLNQLIFQVQLSFFFFSGKTFEEFTK